MKRIAILAFTCIIALSATMKAAPKEKNLSAVFSYSTFYAPETGPYMESYISFDAWNVNFVKTDAGFQAAIDIVLTIRKDDSIEHAKHYKLLSPVIASPDSNRFTFMDIQRMALGNGIHDMEVTLRDLNSDNDPVSFTQKIAILYDKSTPRLSSVQMMNNVRPTTQENILSRMGYDMEPFIDDFLPQQVDKINFYYEIYNINNELKNKNVYTTYFIEEQETGRPLEYTQGGARHNVDDFIPIFGTIDISQVPSGNYNLVVEVYNHLKDRLLYKKVPFFRSNPGVVSDNAISDVSATFAGRMTDEYQLTEYIEALYPIANRLERNDLYEIIKRTGLEEKQIFLYKFWVRRDSLNPESAWMQYRERVDYVNANFSWPKTKGIHTDRGRVYLQYGPPDFVRDEKNFVSIRYMGGGMNTSTTNGINIGSGTTTTGDAPGQIHYLPSQLWRYNQIPGDDINRCFIFWDEYRSGFYKLLNSNAKGELRTHEWERVLCKQQLNEGMIGEVGEQFNRGY